MDYVLVVYLKPHYHTQVHVDVFYVFSWVLDSVTLICVYSVASAMGLDECSFTEIR